MAEYSLHLALWHHRIKTAKLLLENSDLDAINIESDVGNILTLAVRARQLEMVKILIAKGCDHTISIDGEYPFYCAIENGYFEIVEYLFDKTPKKEWDWIWALVLYPNECPPDEVPDKLSEGVIKVVSVLFDKGIADFISEQRHGDITSEQIVNYLKANIDKIIQYEQNKEINSISLYALLEMLKDNDENDFSDAIIKKFISHNCSFKIGHGSNKIDYLFANRTDLKNLKNLANGFESEDGDKLKDIAGSCIEKIEREIDEVIKLVLQKVTPFKNIAGTPAGQSVISFLEYDDTSSLLQACLKPKAVNSGTKRQPVDIAPDIESQEIDINPKRSKISYHIFDSQEEQEKIPGDNILSLSQEECKYLVECLGSLA